MVKQSYLLTDLFLDLLSRDSRHASPVTRHTKAVCSG